LDGSWNDFGTVLPGLCGRAVPGIVVSHDDSAHWWPWYGIQDERERSLLVVGGNHNIDGGVMARHGRIVAEKSSPLSMLDSRPFTGASGRRKDDSGMPIYRYKDWIPKLGHKVLLTPSSIVTGNVEVGDDVSFWFHTVARGDVNSIRIGAGTNIQDGAVLHVSHETYSLDIGRRVVIGHSAVVHGCILEDGALVGIGAKVLDGAVVEAGAQIGAGAVVAPGKRIPAGQLAMGVPARVVRPLTDEESQAIVDNAERYMRLKDEYLRILEEGPEETR